MFYRKTPMVLHIDEKCILKRISCIPRTTFWRDSLENSGWRKKTNVFLQ